MKLQHMLGVWSAAVLAAVFACGGETPTAATCVAGQSIACTGNAGCSGSQVCKSDGTYDTCSCGTPVDGGTTPDGSSNPDGSTTTDSGSDVTSSDGGPWTPKSFAGLALWLDTSVGVVIDPQKVGYVKRWLDQSGNGNNAERVDNNGVGLALDPSAINGHDAVTCGYQTHFEVADARSLQFGTGGFLIAAVFKYGTNGQPDQYTLFQKNSTLQAIIPSNQATLKFTAGTKSLSAALATPKATTLIAQSTMSLEFDGVSTTGPVATEDVSAPGWPLILCGIGSPTSPPQEYAEVIIVKGAAKPADVTALKAYFKSKYNL